MNDFVFKISPNILIGTQTVSRLGSLAREHASRYLVILDPATKEGGVDEKLKKSLTDSDIEFIFYDDLPYNTDTATLTQTLSLARGACVQGVIACGGEKALNLGRGVASLYNEKKDVYDFVAGDLPETKALPLFIIPTSIRDTFLFFERCALIDARSEQICLLKMQEKVTTQVIFDTTLCATLTKNQIASISLNLLCMLVEAYFSKHANFLSDAMVEKAVQLMATPVNASDPLASPELVDGNVLQYGCMASLAVSLAAPGPVTALAFAVHAKHKVSRTLVSAILLPYLLEEGVFAGDKVITLAKMLGAIGESATVEEASMLLAENIRSRIARAGLPARLKELGVSLEQFASCTNEAMHLDFVQYYGKPVSSDSLFNLVKSAY